MMKILLVHNFYRSSSPSGENQVFEAERALLAIRGHEVLAFTRHSDELESQGKWGTIKGALSTPWNPWTTRAIQSAITRFRPDIVHVHNTFPLISPAIFSAIGRRAARVLTLHNYRLFCAAAIPLRGDKVCTECLDNRSALPALRYGCYRGSRAATLPIAMSVQFHRQVGTWDREVDAFISLTTFQRERMIASGLPACRVHVKPNFYPGSPIPLPWESRENVVVFAGRLSSEKGVDVLLQAWIKWGARAPELRILGDGPLRDSLERLAQSAPMVPIRFLGQVPSSVAEQHISKAMLLVVPSRCFEGFPMVLGEAFAFGTPVAVADIGPLPFIVSHLVNGIVFSSGNAESLVAEIRQVWCSDDALRRLGAHAHSTYENEYAENANYKTLINIYNKAISTSQREGAGEEHAN